MTNGADLAGQRDEILRACRKAGSADELFARVAEPLRRAVPFEGSAWFGMDPAMLLPTAPARIENVAPGHCESFWQREFLVEDTNLFQSLARDSKPAAALLDATRNRPARSARYREFLQPQGYGDELRAVLRTGTSVWGTLSLFRDHYAAPFTPQEAAFVASVSAPLAESLKARLITEGLPGRAEPGGPGVLMFDRTGLAYQQQRRGGRVASPAARRHTGIERSAGAGGRPHRTSDRRIRGPRAGHSQHAAALSIRPLARAARLLPARGGSGQRRDCHGHRAG